LARPGADVLMMEAERFEPIPGNVLGLKFCCASALTCSSIEPLANPVCGFQ
jgi:hypothetical protein